MRYCITLYSKGYKKYDRSKLKVQLLLNLDFSNLTRRTFDTTWATVIYFAQLELVRVLEVIRLRNDFQPYHWTSWASRISEKMKKANEGCEGQTKARGWPKTKFQNFFYIFGFLGSILLHDFHIFEFQGRLGQKGHSISWSGLFLFKKVYIVKTSLVAFYQKFWTTSNSYLDG